MKKNIRIIWLFALNFIICSTLAQADESGAFFPMNNGNVWVYSCNTVGGMCFCSKRYKFKITGNEVLNGKVYYIFQKSEININCPAFGCSASLLPFDTLRVDSTTANVYKFSFSNGCAYSPGMILYDSLNSRLNDTIRNNCGTSQWRYKCTDTSIQNIFGNSVQIKTFSETQFESFYRRTYARDIGLISSSSGGQFCTEGASLRGCVINGVLYGDTSMITGVNQVSNEVPTEFSLSQNYPNPFNPVTQIGFRIAESGLVRIVIYDALGREVQTLVNQELQPGMYEVDFEGSNLPSGVYYYVLKSGSFTESRKMVLVK